MYLCLLPIAFYSLSNNFHVPKVHKFSGFSFPVSLCKFIGVKAGNHVRKGKACQ